MTFNQIWTNIEKNQNMPFRTEDGIEFMYKVENGNIVINQDSKTIAKTDMERIFNVFCDEAQGNTLNVHEIPYLSYAEALLSDERIALSCNSEKKDNPVYPAFNAKALALSVGLVYGGIVSLLGVIAAGFGWAITVADILSTLYIGYGPSVLGIVLGFVWGFSTAFVVVFLIVSLYNRIISCNCKSCS